MSLDLSGFIQIAFRKRPITFIYNNESYEFNFYSAYLNKKEVVDYFLNIASQRSLSFNPDSPDTIIMLMKFYMRFQKSEELKTRIPRFVRRGHRKFSVSTLASTTNSETGKKFNSFVTFNKIKYKNNILDARERYNCLIEKMKLEEGRNTDSSNLFEKAIFIREIQDLEIDEITYENYLSDFIIKLNNWEERENLFIETKYGDEETDQNTTITKNEIREIHDEFILFFKDEVDNALFKKLFYDLEGLYFWFWETILLEVYDFIKSSLGEADRKAFLLGYTRQEYLDYHIPIFEPLGEDFINLLNPDERMEFIYALLFDDDVENKLLSKYDNKFTDFIKFYPLWVDIIRLDEKLNDDDRLTIENEPFFRRQRKIGTKEGEDIMGSFDSLFELLKNQDEQSNLEEKIAENLQEDSDHDFDKFINLIATELTEKEREIIDLMLADPEQNTQEIIAGKLGISQSAVNQRYSSARRKLKKASKN